MEFIDPRPWLEGEYQRELLELQKRFGTATTAAERLRFAMEKRKIRRRIFAPLRRGTITW